MSTTFASISMSIDGFIAGPDINVSQAMGEGGGRLHEWLFNPKSEADSLVATEPFARAGAVIAGGRTYKIAIEKAWGGKSPFPVPTFVVTHHIPEVKISGFEFVTEGIEKALELAKIQAGDQDIWVMGGADIIQQFIEANLLDELQINLVHILLGNGTRLFDSEFEHIPLEKIRVLDSVGVTHLKFRLN